MINARLSIVATLLISATVTFVLAIVAFRRRKTVGILATVFTLVSVSVTLYSFGYAMELLNSTLKGVMFWLRVEHIGIQTLPALWLVFALCISGNEKWLTVRRVVSLFVIPAIVLTANFTNGWHQLFYQNPRIIEIGAFSTFHFEKGPIYWVNVVYINLMLLISTILFIRMLIRSAPSFRRQAIVFFVSAIIPWVGMGLYLSGKTPYNLDFSPITLSISVMLFTLGILEFHILDVVPLAHDMIFKGMSDGVLVLDQANRIVDFNPALPLILPEVQQLSIGESILEVLEHYPELVGHIEDNSPATLEFQISCDENLCYYQARISPVLDRQKRYVGKILSLHDITEMKHLMQQLQDLATQDGLTGVFNRRYFNELASREISRAIRYQDCIALIMLDLDHFKMVNDSYGHAAGDAVLISIAKLCYGTIRITDIFGRHGGEEFVIFLPETNFQAAMALAERLRATIEQARIIYKDNSITITASFGVVGVEPPSKITLDDLLLYADKSVYEAKEKGRN
jgi:diguanylate cyclase (GGDEF)-like protein